MQADLQQVYVSAGCNKVVGALSWGDGGVVAYAAHNLVILYDAKVRLRLRRSDGTQGRLDP